MPIGTIAAVGGAVIGAGASIYGASQQSDAIGDAAHAQTNASNAAIAEQRRQYDQSRTDLQPWMTTGGSALSQLAKLYGLDTMVNGQVQQGTGKADFSGFSATPDYQFRQDQSLDQLTAFNAAHGILNSGATQKSVLQRAGDLASGEFNNYANRLAGIAGVGQSSATQVGQFGANAANNISNINIGQGDNLASSYLAQGNVNANMAGQIAGIGSGLVQNWPWGGTSSNKMTTTPPIPWGWGA